MPTHSQGKKQHSKLKWLLIIVIVALTAYLCTLDNVPCFNKILVGILVIILIAFAVIERLKFKETQIETLDVSFMIWPSIIGVITISLTFYKILNMLISNPNGIPFGDYGGITIAFISISAILFAVQVVFIRGNEKRRAQFLGFALFIEILFLGYIGFSYVNDIGNNIGVPSIATLSLVFFLLCYTAIITAIFVIFNTLFPPKNEAKDLKIIMSVNAIQWRKYKKKRSIVKKTTTEEIKKQNN